MIATLMRNSKLPRIATLIIVSACGPAELPVEEITGFSMGTNFSVQIIQQPTARQAPDVSAADIMAVLVDTNDKYSTYAVDSEISEFNRHLSNEWFDTSSDFCVTIAAALKLSAETNGAFDITVGQLVNLWGFGPDDIVLRPPPDDDVLRALESTGFSHLQTNCDENRIRKRRGDLSLDLSAFAKGLAVDRIATLLDRNNVTDYLVEIGGEIRTQGHNREGEAWRIAIEDPKNEGYRVTSHLGVSNAAVATSGDYRSYFDFDGVRYSHAIDPKTGYPIKHKTASVTVIADEAARADALATALLVMGYERGLRYAEEKTISAQFLVINGSAVDAVMTDSFRSVLTH